MSAKILLHHPSILDDPVGAWWLRSGQLHRVYLPDNEPLETVATLMLQELSTDVDWDDYVDRKAESNPRSYDWSSATLEEGTEPEDLLRMLNR